jgi:LacI family transcriptional regulator
VPRRLKLPRVLLLIETSRSYGRGLVEGIGRYVSMHGPWSIEFQERGLADPLTPWLKRWRGDGIISRTVRRADVDRLLTMGTPTVELFADPDLGLPRVYPDNQAAGRLAAEHFRERGIRHVAFFALERVWWVQARYEAFCTAAGQHGVPCDVFLPARHRRIRPDAPQIARWVQALPKPCGLFCACDGFALPIFTACRTLGIAIPEQLAVLGVDNDSVLCAVTQPPLSSVNLGAERIGYEAAALLDRLMAGRRPEPHGLVIEPEGIVARQSTDILLLTDPDVAQAVRIIREHACRGLRVSQVTQAVGLSRRALEQRFRRALGRTPKQEITRLQLERAQQLLRETTLRIEQIAKLCGFTSFKYFPRAFRRETGQTPRAYRQAHFTTPAR